eukprot:CAMPEP_0171491306 /NCGR_PEP_ID=MMETSP0958-20121227/3788_1 /TAXON_ID=87120 /ORGANISM="Aurantiochytrium limacinum, Strain ATCCMYA-1381" /LENGTH=101 /DNA_ID=CAMNT_0012024713 /DNA_START=273 /DNA_END=578 /DNA_ORIENTATION=+
MDEIREKFKANRTEASPEKIRELLEVAQSKLGYLKIVTPRGGRSTSSSSTGGRSRLVFRNGEWVEGGSSILDKRPLSQMDMNEAMSRHRYLLERQHFMHRK